MCRARRGWSRLAGLPLIAALTLVATARPPASKAANATARPPASKAANATAPGRCRPCACRPRPEMRIGVAGGIGGFWSETTGWIRSDGLLRQDIGLRLHRLVELNLNMGSSVERLSFFFQVGATVYPWHRGPYARLTLDMVLAGPGVQPGLSAALGYAYYSKIPLGLFAELQLSARLAPPHTVELIPFGGVFAYF